MQGFLEFLKTDAGILLTICLVVNIAAYIMYGIDKKRAKKGEWRISERTLLLIGFFGGAIGALMGMKQFHHKTMHWYFWVFNIIALCWQLIFIIGVLSGGKLLGLN